MLIREAFGNIVFILLCLLGSQFVSCIFFQFLWQAIVAHLEIVFSLSGHLFIHERGLILIVHILR